MNDGIETGGTVLALDTTTRVPQRRKANARTLTATKKQRFLDALALTCNVERSAAHAGVADCTLYRHRAKDACFAEQWRAAFELGYERLEMLMLEHGGAGVPLEPADPTRAAAAGVTITFDFDRALKLLQFHRGRVGTGTGPGKRSFCTVRATREETNVVLMKALVAATRRIEKTRGTNG